MQDRETRLKIIQVLEQKKQGLDEYFRDRIEEWHARWPDDEKGPQFSKDLNSFGQAILDQMIDLNRELLDLEDQMRQKFEEEKKYLEEPVKINAKRKQPKKKR